MTITRNIKEVDDKNLINTVHNFLPNTTNSTDDIEELPSVKEFFQSITINNAITVIKI